MEDIMIYGALIILACFATWLSDRYIQRKLFAPRFPNPASPIDTSLLHLLATPQEE